MRRCRGILLVFAFAVGLTPIATDAAARASDGTEGGSDGGGGGTAEDAAKEIGEARDAANAAAAAFWDAQDKLDQVTKDKTKLDAQTADLQEQVDDLRKVVETVVVNRYIGSTSSGIDLLSGTIGPTEQAQTAVLVGVIDEASTISLDDYNVLLDKLADSIAKSNQAAADLQAAQDDYKAKEQQANDRIAQLKEVEKDRLNDEAVQKALEAQQAKAAEAAQKAAAEQQRKDQAEAAAKLAKTAADNLAAIVAAEGAGADGGDDGEVVTPVGPVNQASESSAGGTTGGGGSGGRPVAVLPPAIYGQGDEWICPLPSGTYAFSDTYGQARSGGRTHQGVDMISARGTPIYAVVDGVATPRENVLGGKTIGLDGTDGNHYYYAHLDAWATVGPVTKGTVIGIVGDTGNARFSTPHLHFEIHPNHGDAVNPTPTIAANC